MFIDKFGHGPRASGRGGRAGHTWRPSRPAPDLHYLNPSDDSLEEFDAIDMVRAHPFDIIPGRVRADFAAGSGISSPHLDLTPGFEPD